MKTDVRNRAAELADELIGTSKSLRDVLPEEEETLELLQELEELAVLCETCGWWVSADEADDDGNCEECHNDGE